MSCDEDFGIAEDFSDEIPSVSDDELKEVTGDFEAKASIEECSYGRVYFGYSGSGQAAAVDQEPLPTQVYMESRLRHDNVIELVGYCVDGSSRVLTYEFDTIGSIRDILDGGKGDIEGAPPGQVLSWAQRFQIAIDVAKGVWHLHDEKQPRTIHHDINSTNILLFKDHVAKTDDSNLSNQTQVMVARLATFDLGPFAGNSTTGQLDPNSDVHKYGVLLLELITGRKPVDLKLPEGEQKLEEWYMKSFSSYDVVIGSFVYKKFDKVLECIDQRLGEDYILEAVKKVAVLAELCLKGEFAPTMDYVVNYFGLILLELDAGELDAGLYD